MPGTVSYANWTVTFSVPALTGGGMNITNADFQGKRVLGRASQPFVLVPYHSHRPNFKDGLSPACGGAPFRAIIPTAPDASEDDLPSSAFAANDRAFDPSDNPGGAIQVEQRPSTLLAPESLVIWAKFAAHNYQYVHRWEFQADGAIVASAGVAGQLLRTDEDTAGHLHHFYFRLDFDILSTENNLVQRFGHPSSDAGADGWSDILVESVETYDPAMYTKWRVLNKAPKPNGRFPSYELIPSSEGQPDGLVSTADLWVVRFKNKERGAEVRCTDAVLSNQFVNGESVDGTDVVLWYCSRLHHDPRQFGEERNVVPYKFVGFRLEPRDFLDDTPSQLYATTPPSP